ncbi:MAG TPA: YfiR family protein [Thermoanaerobaculia bacterium]
MLWIAGLAVAQICVAATAEYRVKAAFLYKFATYIRWPAATSGTPATTFVIGILGSDPFGASLDDVVRDQTVQGRAIRITRLTRQEDALACDLVFVASSEEANLGKILAFLKEAPVLTVSDVDQFAEKGGMIGLVTTDDNRIRFDINKAVLERAGLKASSQLLQLARIVDDPRTRRPR